MQNIIEKATIKSDQEITSNGFTGSSKNGTEWFRGNGLYRGSLTTIRPKSSRKVHYNQINGEMAHCSVLDFNNHVLLMDEAVRNGATYKLMRYGEIIFLDSQTMTTTESVIQQGKIYNLKLVKFKSAVLWKDDGPAVRLFCSKFSTLTRYP